MFNRLTEVEKIQLRLSTPDRLLWLWHSYKHEPALRHLNETEGLLALRQLQERAVASFSGVDSTFGQTWLF